MELQQLMYFESLSRTQNFTHTANELHVTQPTVTTAIKNLERELDTLLIDRENGAFRLTAAGEELLWRAEIVLRNVREISTQVPLAGKQQKQHLFIGVPPMSCAHMYPKILREFTAQYPDIEVHILDYCNAETAEKIRQEELDLGFLVIPLSETPEFTYLPLETGSLRVIMSERNPLADREIIHIEDLIEEKILMYEKDTSYIERRMARAFADCGVVWEIDTYYNNMITIYDLVAQDLGISFAMSNASPTLKRVEGIVEKPFAVPIHYTLGLARKTDKKESPAVKAFLEYIQREHQIEE